MALVQGCHGDKDHAASVVKVKTVRCATRNQSGQPFPALQYTKTGALCVGKGENKDKNDSQLSVICRAFTGPSETGLIKAEDGKADQRTGDCLFSLPEGQSRHIERDSAGNYVVQDYTASGDKSDQAEAIACVTTQATLDIGSKACNVGGLVLPSDGSETEAMIGVQGVCEKAETCREVSKLSESALEKESEDCVSAQGKWRHGTCSLTSGEYRFGCLKTPAKTGEDASSVITWTKDEVACTP